MALLFWEGFDSYSSMADLRAARPFIYPNWNTRLGWEALFYTSGGRFGGARIVGDGNVWGPGLIHIGALGYSPTEMFTGHGVYLPNGYADGDGLLQIFGNAFTSSTGDVRITINNGGIIYAYNFNNTLLANSASGTVTSANWFWLETRTKMSTNSSTADGIFEVWVNNTKVLSNTACITKRSNSSTGWGGISFQSYYADGGNSFDDIYITDTSGSAPWNGRLGDCRIVSLPPVKNGIYNTNTSTANVGISANNSSAGVTISNNGVSIYVPGGQIAKSTHYTASGNLYFEVTVRDSHNSGSDEVVGITDRRATASVNGSGPAFAFGVKPFNRTIYSNQSSVGNIPATLAAGNTMCFAVNLDQGKFWIKPNPSSDWNSNTGANPANGAGAYTFTNANRVTLAPYIEADYGSTYNINYGNYTFEGSVPSGFSAWNSLNGNTSALINENLGYTTDSFTIPNVANNYETYTFATIPSSNVSSVIATAVVSVQKKTDAGSATIKHVVVSGQAYNSASIGLGTSILSNRTEWLTNPNTGTQWTKSQINNAQTGIVVG